ncbi:acetate--CoA ligase family protein [Marinobacterium lutimaris]|uniref:Acyl-CoA synthetase (NDP forming) n=1 Tax=Marinobacterium lutimaris TaxID=568106 RepID=A0A1H6CQD7_9GAMM|nr:acetate--CoA ligase family protein [Marinobacterium lutimaris]SEG75058.1 Acyl-CoA synthetase (NDP forming) [Marinobacterium lutimaris]
MNMQNSAGVAGQPFLGDTRRDIRPIFNPESVAIIGMSSKPGSAGQVVLNNLIDGGFKGEVHLVGRSGGMLGDRQILTDIAELPEGVELAILMLPSAAVLDAVKACVARGVRGAVCFASGFAEMGAEGREQQRIIAETAAAGGMTLLGPNTVGYFNYVNAFYVMMVELQLPAPLDPEEGPAVAVVAQSGGIGAHIAASLRARGVPLSYMMTTGNEAQTGLADMVSYFAADEYTGAIVVYAEQIRSAPDFVAAVKEARSRGKGVVLLHPGRSERSQEAAKSHTGALAGNHAAMQLMAEYAGVAVVDSLEEAIDVSQLLLRYPTAPVGGMGLATASGAICGLSQDYVEPLGLELPPLSQEQVAALKEHLPDFLPPRNPLDLGTLVSFQPDLIETGVKALLADSSIGSAMISMAMPGPEASLVWLKYYLAATAGSEKPAIFVMQNEDVPLSPEFIAEARRHRAIVMRSPERAIRALARITRFGRRQAMQQQQAAALSHEALARVELGQGVLPEWSGKQILRELSIPVPDGALARSADEAVSIASDIGYPVVIKAQSAKLAHKSEVGGVLLNIADEAQLRNAWTQLYANVRKAEPELELDGALVEKMGARGLELVVGASRDPQWGPILMVGLGGVWVEALGDVQLLPPQLPREAIIEKLHSLKASKLLSGFRGEPAVDVEAVADVVAKVGQLMVERPEIQEIDINPLVVYADGKGVAAQDVLVVTE